MSTGALLLKAIRSLPDDEQERLLVSLLDRVAGTADAGPPGADLPGTPGARLRSLQLELTSRGLQPVAPPLAELPQAVAEHGLKVLPVRLPAGDYERLRDWSKQHEFSMAVIVRTLVERFLNGQAAAG